jgi:hypothetical protein
MPQRARGRRCPARRMPGSQRRLASHDADHRQLPPRHRQRQRRTEVRQRLPAAAHGRRAATAARAAASHTGTAASVVTGGLLSAKLPQHGRRTRYAQRRMQRHERRVAPDIAQHSHLPARRRHRQRQRCAEMRSRGATITTCGPHASAACGSAPTASCHTGDTTTGTPVASWLLSTELPQHGRRAWHVERRMQGLEWRVARDIAQHSPMSARSRHCQRQRRIEMRRADTCGAPTNSDTARTAACGPTTSASGKRPTTATRRCDAACGSRITAARFTAARPAPTT